MIRIPQPSRLNHPNNKPARVITTPIASYTNRSRMIARRACDSPAFLAYQVKHKAPIMAAPYSRAGNVWAPLIDSPKSENVNSGTTSNNVPSTRQTMPLMIIKVLRLISVSPLSIQDSFQVHSCELEMIISSWYYSQFSVPPFVTISYSES